MEKKKSTLRRLLTACGILALLAAIAYSVYYFLFAEDEDELDGDFFDEAEEGQEVQEAAEAVKDQVEEAAQTAQEAAREVEFSVP